MALGKALSRAGGGGRHPTPQLKALKGCLEKAFIMTSGFCSLWTTRAQGSLHPREQSAPKLPAK